MSRAGWCDGSIPFDLNRDSGGDSPSLRPAGCGDPCRSDLKIILGVSDNLAVAGVVGSFDCNDAIADMRVLFAEVLGKLRLRVGGADDQDFAGIADGVHHLCKKLLVE